MSIRNTEDTILVPGRVLMNSSEGRIVFAVVLIAPETMPSAIPLYTSIVPKYEGSLMRSRAASMVMPLWARSSA